MYLHFYIFDHIFESFCISTGETERKEATVLDFIAESPPLRTSWRPLHFLPRYTCPIIFPATKTLLFPSKKVSFHAQERGNPDSIFSFFYPVVDHSFHPYLERETRSVFSFIRDSSNFNFNRFTWLPIEQVPGLLLPRWIVSRSFVKRREIRFELKNIGSISRKISRDMNILHEYFRESGFLFNSLKILLFLKFSICIIQC